MKRKLFSLFLDQNEIDALKDISEYENVSMSKLIREAIDNLVLVRMVKRHQPEVIKHEMSEESNESNGRMETCILPSVRALLCSKFTR